MIHIVYRGLEQYWLESQMREWLGRTGEKYWLTVIQAYTDLYPFASADENFAVPVNRLNLDAVPSDFQETGLNAMHFFRERTRTMHRISLNRFQREMKEVHQRYTRMIYWDSLAGPETPVWEIARLGVDQVVAKTGLMEVDWHCFATRPSNFDRVGLLWKREDVPYINAVNMARLNNNGRRPYRKPEHLQDLHKVAWWTWLRQLRLKVTTV